MIDGLLAYKSKAPGATRPHPVLFTLTTLYVYVLFFSSCFKDWNSVFMFVLTAKLTCLQTVGYRIIELCIIFSIAS